MTQRKNAPEPIKVVVTFTGDLALGLDHEASLTGENYPNFLRRILKAHLDREADALKIALPLDGPESRALTQQLLDRWGPIPDKNPNRKVTP